MVTRALQLFYHMDGDRGEIKIRIGKISDFIADTLILTHKKAG